MNNSPNDLAEASLKFKESFFGLDSEVENEAFKISDGRFLRVRYRIDFAHQLHCTFEEGPTTDTDGVFSFTVETYQQWFLSHEVIDKALAGQWYEMKGNPGRQTLDYLLIRIRETKILNDL